MPKLRLKNGVTLGYREFGSGPKVLLSTQNHFFTGCHMELLGKPPYDYHVYLVTTRGFGESDHCFDPEPQNWIKTWGEDLLAFADALGAEQFYYTGISHGTLAGWYVAFHQPGRLKGFVAASGIPLFTEPGAPLPISIPQCFKDGIIGNREALKKLAWDTHYPSNDPARLTRREACRNEHLEILMSRSEEEFRLTPSTLNPSDAATKEEFYAQLAAISAPVMILFGIRDHSATLGQVLEVAGLIPGAELMTYEHFEHAGPDECPEMTARDCDRFFYDVEGRIL